MPQTVGPYEMGKEVGKGATATVYLGFDPLSKYQVAVKVLKHAENSRKKLEHEVRILKSLSHENIAGLHTVIQDEKTTYLALEFIGGGELFDTVIKWKRDEREALTFHYFHQLLNGLHYLHSTGVCHRDLKLENLLLSKEGVLKIADFGVAQNLEFNPMKTCCGSPDYIAPEILADKKGYDGRLADLWSVGVIFYAMLCGEFPFENTQHILKGKYKTPKWFPKMAKDSLLDRLLVVKPADRMQSVEEAMRSEWYMSFSQERNSFGMFYQVQKGAKDAHQSKLLRLFRRVTLRVLIQTKVCFALRSPSIKGEPRDVHQVSQDRLRFLLRMMSEMAVQAPASKRMESGSVHMIQWAEMAQLSVYQTHFKLMGEMGRSDLKKLTPDERLAVFLNVYHLILIHGFVSGGQHLEDMKEQKRDKFFNTVSYIVGYTNFTLSDIHHGIMRGNKKKGGLFSSSQQIDPKIDSEKAEFVLKELDPVAVLCLSHLTTGTAKIRVYEGSRLREQMELTVKEFLSSEVVINSAKKSVQLPTIFKDFDSDFGKSKSERLDFVKKYLYEEKKAALDMMMKSGTPSITYSQKKSGLLFERDSEITVWTKQIMERFDWTPQKSEAWRKRNKIGSLRRFSEEMTVPPDDLIAKKKAALSNTNTSGSMKGQLASTTSLQHGSSAKHMGKGSKKFLKDPAFSSSHGEVEDLQKERRKSLIMEEEATIDPNAPFLGKQEGLKEANSTGWKTKSSSPHGADSAFSTPKSAGSSKKKKSKSPTAKPSSDGSPRDSPRQSNGLQKMESSADSPRHSGRGKQEADPTDSPRQSNRALAQSNLFPQEAAKPVSQNEEDMVPDGVRDSIEQTYEGNNAPVADMEEDQPGKKEKKKKKSAKSPSKSPGKSPNSEQSEATPEMSKEKKTKKKSKGKSLDTDSSVEQSPSKGTPKKKNKSPKEAAKDQMLVDGALGSPFESPDKKGSDKKKSKKKDTPNVDADKQEEESSNNQVEENREVSKEVKDEFDAQMSHNTEDRNETVTGAAREGGPHDPAEKSGNVVPESSSKQEENPPSPSLNPEKGKMELKRSESRKQQMLRASSVTKIRDAVPEMKVRHSVRRRKAESRACAIL